MGTVVHLRQRDAIDVDSNRIAGMFRRMGAVQAEMTIMTAMGHLARCLRDTDTALRDNKIDQVPQYTQSARIYAEDIGLISLAAILAQLESACQGQDNAAIHALWQRAARVGDRSFVDLWELPLLQM